MTRPSINTTQHHASWTTTVHEFRIMDKGVIHRYLWTITDREGKELSHTVTKGELFDVEYECNELGPLETALLVREFELILSGRAK